MTSKFPKISICIPVYNESETLLINLEIIRLALDNMLGKFSYELIIIDNGSTDNTYNIARKQSSNKLRVLHINKKGLGSAYRSGINISKYKYCLLSAIDFPFGVSDLRKVKSIWKDYDIIYGSKAHPQSIVNTPLKRNIYSHIYRFLLKILFKIKIYDPQGTIFINKSKMYNTLKLCNSDNAFFTTQIAIYGQKHGLKMTEVPITMKKNSNRKSKYTLFGLGKDILISMLKEYLKS